MIFPGTIRTKIYTKMFMLSTSSKTSSFIYKGGILTSCFLVNSIGLVFQALKLTHQSDAQGYSNQNVLWYSIYSKHSKKNELVKLFTLSFKCVVRHVNNLWFMNPQIYKKFPQEFKTVNNIKLVAIQKTGRLIPPLRQLFNFTYLHIINFNHAEHSFDRTLFFTANNQKL
jgi:hypothetical protein